MNALVLLPGNTMVVELRDLYNVVTKRYLRNATVRIVSIKNESDSEVAGTGVPIQLAYVANSRGVYRGKVPAAAALLADHTYTLTITAVDAAGSSARWEIAVPAKVRDR